MAMKLGKKADAVFRNLYPWENLQSFNQFIFDSIIYNSNGIVAINKPYGVKINQEIENDKPTNEPIKKTLISGSAFETRYSISQSLPFLQNELNEKNLRIVKSAERFASGIILLATNDKSEKKIRAAISTVKCSKTSAFKYLTVTIGQPQQQSVNDRVSILLKQSESDNSKHSIIVNELSVKKLRKGIMKPAFVNIERIITNEETNTSLLKISSTQLKWLFLRVYCAHKGYPILGDNMFGPRVRWIFGKPFLVNNTNQSAYNAPNIPAPIQHKLSISENNVNFVPTHLHLNELRVRFNKVDVTITAEPPDFFQWTCEQLGLNTQENKSELEVKV